MTPALFFCLFLCQSLLLSIVCLLIPVHKKSFPKENFRRKRSRDGWSPEKELQIIIIWLYFCISLWKLEMVGMWGCECYCVSSNIIQKTPISWNGMKKEVFCSSLLLLEFFPLLLSGIRPSLFPLSHTHTPQSHPQSPHPPPPSTSSKENKNKSCLLLSLLLLHYLASFRSSLNRSQFYILWKKIIEAHLKTVEI